MMILKDDIIFIDVDKTLLIEAEGCFIPQDVNEKLVKQIKEWKNSGMSIVVWTSNKRGTSWAVEAVEKCGIKEYVDLCMRKPFKIVDDYHLEDYTIIDPLTFEETHRKSD